MSNVLRFNTRDAGIQLEFKYEGIDVSGWHETASRIVYIPGGLVPWEVVDRAREAVKQRGKA